MQYFESTQIKKIKVIIALIALIACNHVIKRSARLGGEGLMRSDSLHKEFIESSLCKHAADPGSMAPALRVRVCQSDKATLTG